MEVSTHSEQTLSQFYVPMTPLDNLDLTNSEVDFERQVDNFFNVQQNLTNNKSATVRFADITDSEILTSERIEIECLDLYFKDHKKNFALCGISGSIPVFPFRKLQEIHKYSRARVLRYFEKLWNISNQLQNENYESFKEQILSKIERIRTQFEKKNKLRLLEATTTFLQELRQDFHKCLFASYNPLYNLECTSEKIVNENTIHHLKFYAQKRMDDNIKNLTKVYLDECKAMRNLIEKSILQNEIKIPEYKIIDDEFTTFYEWIREYGSCLACKNVSNQNKAENYLRKVVSEEFELQKNQITGTVQDKIFFDNMCERTENITAEIGSRILQVFSNIAVDCCAAFNQFVKTTINYEGNKFKIFCKQFCQKSMTRAVADVCEKADMSQQEKTLTRDHMLSFGWEKYAKRLQENIKEAFYKTNYEFTSNKESMEYNSNLNRTTAAQMPSLIVSPAGVLPYGNTDIKYDPGVTSNLHSKNNTQQSLKRKNDQMESQQNCSKRACRSEKS